MLRCADIDQIVHSFWRWAHGRLSAGTAQPVRRTGGPRRPDPPLRPGGAQRGGVAQHLLRRGGRHPAAVRRLRPGSTGHRWHAAGVGAPADHAASAARERRRPVALQPHRPGRPPGLDHVRRSGSSSRPRCGRACSMPSCLPIARDTRP